MSTDVGTPSPVADDAEAPRPGRMRRAVATLGSRGSSILLVVIILAVWQFVVEVFDVPSYLLPAPSTILVTLVDGLTSGLLLRHTWVTLQEILGGFAIAVACAFLLAFAVTKWRWVERAVLPLIFALQSVPKVALAPLILTWFGFGITSKVVTTGLVAFFPLVVNLITGLQSADRDRVDMFRALGATEWTIFRKLRLPNAMPYVFAGLDIAVIFCIIGAIVAEFVGSQAGLGYLIQASAINLDVSMTFAVLVILSALGMILHAIVTFFARRVVFWQGRGFEAISGQ